MTDEETTVPLLAVLITDATQTVLILSKINYAMNFGILSHCFSQDPVKYKVSSDVRPITLLRSGVPHVALLE